LSANKNIDLYQQHTKNIHKYDLREMVFWGEMCVFFLSDNHVKTGNEEELGYWFEKFHNLIFNRVQIRIWTCIKNILKIYISIICGKWYFRVKFVVFFK
jgi:hypothetical protein